MLMALMMKYMRMLLLNVDYHDFLGRRFDDVVVVVDDVVAAVVGVVGVATADSSVDGE